jgi:hypothetical protein
MYTYESHKFIRACLQRFLDNPSCLSIYMVLPLNICNVFSLGLNRSIEKPQPEPAFGWMRHRPWSLRLKRHYVEPRETRLLRLPTHATASYLNPQDELFLLTARLFSCYCIMLNTSHKTRKCRSNAVESSSNGLSF